METYVNEIKKHEKTLQLKQCTREEKKGGIKASEC